MWVACSSNSSTRGEWCRMGVEGASVISTSACAARAGVECRGVLPSGPSPDRTERFDLLVDEGGDTKVGARCGEPSTARVASVAFGEAETPTSVVSTTTAGDTVAAAASGEDDADADCGNERYLLTFGLFSLAASSSPSELSGVSSRFLVVGRLRCVVLRVSCARAGVVALGIGGDDGGDDDADMLDNSRLSWLSRGLRLWPRSSLVSMLVAALRFGCGVS